MWFPCQIPSILSVGCVAGQQAASQQLSLGWPDRRRGSAWGRNLQVALGSGNRPGMARSTARLADGRIRLLTATPGLTTAHWTRPKQITVAGTEEWRGWEEAGTRQGGELWRLGRRGGEGWRRRRCGGENEQEGWESVVLQRGAMGWESERVAAVRISQDRWKN